MIQTRVAVKGKKHFIENIRSSMSYLKMKRSFLMKKNRNGFPSSSQTTTNGSHNMDKLRKITLRMYLGLPTNVKDGSENYCNRNDFELIRPVHIEAVKKGITETKIS